MCPANLTYWNHQRQRPIFDLHRSYWLSSLNSRRFPNDLLVSRRIPASDLNSFTSPWPLPPYLSGISSSLVTFPNLNFLNHKMQNWRNIKKLLLVLARWAKWVQCLLDKHEDLNLDPRHYCKKLYVPGEPGTVALSKAKPGGLRHSLASRDEIDAQHQVHWETLFQNIRWRCHWARHHNDDHVSEHRHTTLVVIVEIL